MLIKFTDLDQDPLFLDHEMISSVIVWRQPTDAKMGTAPLPQVNALPKTTIGMKTGQFFVVMEDVDTVTSAIEQANRGF